MSDDDATRQRLVELMTQAQSGLAHEARPGIDRLLRAADPQRPTTLHAAAWYVRGICSLELDDRAACHADVLELERVSHALAEPGWEALALALRAVLESRDFPGGRVVADLVQASAALQECRDEGVRAWAECGLGWAYSATRLYELAVPHLERAVEIGSDPIGQAESMVVYLCNLAEVHLRLAQEMHRVGLGDPGPHLERVIELAEDARREVQRPAVSARWLVLCDALALAALSPDDVDPERARRVRDDAERCHLLQESILMGCVLALSLSARGRHDEARSALDAARLDEGSAAVEPDLEIHLSWVALQVDLAAWPASRRGHEHGVVMARASRSGRVASVAAMRRALRAADLERDHAREHAHARVDPLTGIGNRRAWTEWTAAAAAAGADVTVVLIDLDGLKHLNDSQGHAAGDGALRAVGRVATASIRARDIAARIGGDEFAIGLLDPAGSAPAELVARLRRRLADEWTDGAGGTPIGISAGAASGPARDAAEVLLPAADLALYEDKRRRSAGRTRGA